MLQKTLGSNSTNLSNDRIRSLNFFFFLKRSPTECVGTSQWYKEICILERIIWPYCAGLIRGWREEKLKKADLLEWLPNVDVRCSPRNARKGRKHHKKGRKDHKTWLIGHGKPQRSVKEKTKNSTGRIWEANPQVFILECISIDVWVITVNMFNHQLETD